MRSLLIFCGFLCLPLLLWSQSEEPVQGFRGVPYVEEALKLAGDHFEDKNWDAASQLAEEAYKEASRIGNQELMAQSLNLEARALIEKTSWKNANRRRAMKKLRESNFLTQDTDLRLDNLRTMKRIAQVREQYEEVLEIEKQISEITGETSVSLTARVLANRGKNAREILESATEQYERINRERKSLEETKSTLMEQLEAQSDSLEEMSREQMKAELLLSRQKNLLDSLSFLALIDSIKLDQQSLLLSKQETELEAKEARINLARSRFRLFIAIGVIGVLIIIGILTRYLSVRKYNAALEEKNQIIENERERSESLLLNILPGTVAEELKEHGRAAARNFEQVTVLFTDFQRFSQLARSLPPGELVNMLDYCFKEFDDIVARNGLEKIKTIGDAYMCAGGLPEPDERHPVAVVRAAIEIQAFLSSWKEEQKNKQQPFFEARLGIHTGPVIAGVVGSRKFAYDIWGDTVNTASRIESEGAVGKVNISEKTHELVKGVFHCSHRGKVPVKHLGEVEMYFVEGFIE